MLGRTDVFRAAAIIVLIAALIAGLATMNRRSPPPIAQDLPAAPSPDDLAAELRRCSALGPQDAEDARCMVVWEENRRRFFGRPARPLPPVAAPATALSDSKGEAR